MYARGSVAEIAPELSGGPRQKSRRESDRDTRESEGTLDVVDDLVRISEYQMAVVPRLLQTARYARTRVTSWRAAGEMPGGVDETVDEWLTGQRALLRGAPVQYRALLDEALLVRRCGPAGVRHGQLARLLELARLPTVQLRVLGYDAHVSAFQLPPGPFTVYTRRAGVRTVSLDTGGGEVRLHNSEVIRGYTRLFDRLWNAAFGIDASAQVIGSALAAEDEDP